MVSSFFGGFCFSPVLYTVELSHWVKRLVLFRIFLYIRGDVCVFILMCVDRLMCTYVFFVEGPENNLTCCSSVCRSHFAWKGVSHWPGSHQVARLTGQEVSGIHLSLPSQVHSQAWVSFGFLVVVVVFDRVSLCNSPAVLELALQSRLISKR